MHLSHTHIHWRKNTVPKSTLSFKFLKNLFQTPLLWINCYILHISIYTSFWKDKLIKARCRHILKMVIHFEYLIYILYIYVYIYHISYISMSVIIRFFSKPKYNWFYIKKMCFWIIVIWKVYMCINIYMHNI